MWPGKNLLLVARVSDRIRVLGEARRRENMWKESVCVHELED